MIDLACKSLNKFLHDNVEYITRVKNNINTSMVDNNLSILRRAWIDLNPEFKEHDLSLDIVWEGLSGAGCMMWSYYDPETGNQIPTKRPTAKSFKVVIRNWDEEITIHNKMINSSWMVSNNLLTARN